MKRVLGMIVFCASLAVLAGVGPVYKDDFFSKELNLESAAAAQHPIVQKAPHALYLYDVAVKCASGTVNASLLVDGVSVTGCSGLSVSSTETSGTCVGQVVAKNATLALQTSANSSCVNLGATVRYKR